MPTGTTGAARSLIEGSYADAIFSPDGKTLYTVADNTVTAVDVATGKTVATYTVGARLGGADISPDGRTLIVADERSGASGSFYRIDLATGTIDTYTTSPASSAYGVYDVSFLTNTTAIVSTLGGYNLLTYDLTTGAATQSLRAGNATLTRSANGAQVLIGHNDYQGTTTVMASDGSVLATRLLNRDPFAYASLPAPLVGAQAISADGSELVPARTDINPVQITDGTFHHARAPETYNADALAFSTDGKTLFAATGDELVAINATTGRAIGAYTLAAPVASAYDGITGITVGYGDLIRADADGVHLSVICKTGVELLDLTTAYTSGSGNDTLTGSGTLLGLDGNDSLTASGTARDARLYGGRGDDTYYVADYFATIYEKAGEGTDTVHATLSYTLGDNIENLSLDGPQAFDGYGNALANVVTGNVSDNGLYAYSGDDTLIGDGGNDTLDGGAGADVMIGGVGDDTAIVDDAGDVVVEKPNEGHDTILSSVSYTLPANVEALILTGTAAIDGTGNDAGDTITGNVAANVLTGGAGDDRLDGGAGADVMIGGAGDDTVIVDDAGDVVVEKPNEGHDTILSWVSYTLPANVEALVLTGTAAIDGTGNDAGDTITGNSAANVLTGGAGNDVLDGGAGADVLIGGAGDDSLLGGDGIDIVYYDGLARRFSTSAFAGASGTIAGGSIGTDTLSSVDYVRFQDGFLTFDPDSDAAKLMRLYDAALARAPDAHGFDVWLDALDQGTSFADIAQDFLDSPEFQSVTGSLSNADYVELLYGRALKRASDPDGKATWIAALDGGISRADVLIGISESDEHRALTADALGKGLFVTDISYREVAALYDTFADRKPDEAGLDNWVGLLKSGQETLADVAAGFAASPEFRNRTDGLSNADLVELLYHNALDRGSDAPGKAAWLGALDAGLSRGGLLLGFSESTEHLQLISADLNGGVALG